MSAQLPTSLWVEGVLATLTARGTYYHFIQKGNPASGLVMVKINNLKGKIRLFIQERDFIEDKLVWVNALGEEYVEESTADAYIRRTISRDPDIWALEVEDEALENPFDL